TVLRADLSGDLRNATVHVSVMGSEADQRRAMNGLKSAAGFLQAKVAARLQTRFTPVLAFKLDESVKKSIEISRLIDDALAADRRGHGRTEAEAEADVGSAHDGEGRDGADDLEPDGDDPGAPDPPERP